MITHDKAMIFGYRLPPARELESEAVIAHHTTALLALIARPDCQLPGIRADDAIDIAAKTNSNFMSLRKREDAQHVGQTIF